MSELAKTKGKKIMSAIWLVTHYAWNNVEVQGWLLMAAVSGLLAVVANQWDADGNSVMNPRERKDMRYIVEISIVLVVALLLWIGWSGVKP